MDMSMYETKGPYVSRERAAEIASMEEFGLPEFRELTGIGTGRYGIYLIAVSGVSIPALVDDDPDLNAEEQHKTYLAKLILSVDFPCTPLKFMDWYDGTRGIKTIDRSGKVGQAPSDFPLATGFVEKLKQINQLMQRKHRPSAPSTKIMGAFKVKFDSLENRNWWDPRMRNPARYKLNDSRASKGRAKTPSYWYPELVAAWLIDKGFLAHDAVIKAVKQHFPEIDTTFL